MDRKRSDKLFAEARRYIPGGVDSPVRAFKAVGGNPVFIARGDGSRVWDEDGNDFIDYVCSWGPLLLGHAHPNIVQALKRAAENGTSFGAPTALETRLAGMICEALPAVDMVRFVSSGTEAAMSAVRLARGFTDRYKLVKFAGCYHGHSDGLLARPARVWPHWACPTAPAYPRDTPRARLSRRITTSTRWRAFSSTTPTSPP